MTGIVEGFYGRQWSWTDRHDYLEFLVRCGFNCYLYCPKGDPHLRKRWSVDWPAADAGKLRELAGACSERGVFFGVGLTPFELPEDYSRSARQLLRQRIARIDELGGSQLAILFDDLPASGTDPARRQARIVEDVLHWSSAQRLLVCPTWYSFDPRLEQLFGARPPNYWQQLGQLLPAEVDILWTGNQVCSAAIDSADVSAIADLLGRPPLLWDNYPVNDGAQTSNYLHLRPLGQRDPGLASHCRGHLCNPMNQPWLSRAGLSGLARLYSGREPSMSSIYGPELAAQLLRDTSRFQDRGLSMLGAEELRELKRRYRQLSHPAAAEVVNWLEGRYRFDPACLTG